MNSVASNNGGHVLPAFKISPALKITGSLLSYIFHPIFLPLYAVWFIAYIHPSYLSGFSNGMRLRTVLITAQNAVFYPLFCVLLLKGVGFISSIFLRTQKDRIIPYMACGIFFFWTFTVFKEQALFPKILPSFMLGVFLASSAALLANIYFKISMHAIGVGGLVGLFIIIAGSNTMLMTWPVSVALLIAGLVCSARLLITDHTPRDIYTGLGAGLLAQFVAAFIIL
ncbi:MAG: hypothetical protein H7Y86_00715 [Rhizobacter sp.]|nr:hypothetical protein [Ferruginibacter sp.]